LALFYLAEPRFGGWVTFTAHLALTMRTMGYEVALYKVGQRSEPPTRQRDYGRGLTYRNVDRLEAKIIAGGTRSIITAVGPKNVGVAEELIAEGAHVVIHDPTELSPKMFEALRTDSRHQTVIVRESNRRHLEAEGIRPVFIRHPYVQQATVGMPRVVNAVAISRVDWDKHTTEIARANERLPKEKRIIIYGAENGMYAHHKLDHSYPRWREQYRGTYPAELDAAVRIAETARYCVDLSAIAGDGDGTQYTFLEAWDAGAILVVNRKWLVTGEGVVRHGETALAVANTEELVEAVQLTPRRQMQRAGKMVLAEHDPQKVGPEYERLWS